jgi:hypothetical protein
MIDLLFPYLIAVVGFVVVVVLALVSQHFAERARVSYEEKQRQLPDFLRYTDFRAELDELELALAERREEAARAEALIAEADTKRHWLADNEQRIQDAERAQREFQEAEAKLVSAIEQLAQKQEDLRKVQDERHKAEFEVKRFAEQSLLEQDKLAAAQRERTEVLKHLEHERQRLDAFRQEIAELQRQLAAQSVERDRLGAQKAALADEVDKLARRRAELAESLREISGQAAALQKSIASLEGREAGVKARLEASGAGPTAIDDPLDEVRVPLLGVGSKQVASINAGDDEIAALSRFEESLREQGLKFHRRVIDAFHTALKTQREAPLLVLAGISGTGKSLLPQRYAEHMGMHSLLVPVQPRWDGPQDLLGFFNYLEGRYKPTELIRTLVQFDRFDALAGGDGRSGRLDGRMLLVILDEMNLARVEYYFSEFLSRLELRRDIDPSSGEKRHQASLAIDVGASEHGRRDHYVYVDRNVLFVGTINEDESTQALSDKVVDRANVLRFAKPALMTDIATDGRKRAAKRGRGKATTPHMPREIWEKWIDDAKELDTATRHAVLSQVEELNNALQMIGKPFGYRTRDAILAYVRNYPARGTDRVQLAVADQVEQRVLPKLRGVGPNDTGGGRQAVRAVRDVVEKLGDEALLRAIDRGLEGGHGDTFLWHGVDRSDERR